MLRRVDQPFFNQGLFSDHYLETAIPGLPEWREDVSAEKRILIEIWESARELVHGHEGQTEEHWIRPVLLRLGFAFQVQTAVPDLAGGSMRWPDYALFESDEARAAAESSAGSRAYFGDALAIADAKVWDSRLDRRSEAASRNPNYQIDLYLRETDRLWGVLTNGRLWRLYCRDTSYRLDSYYEVDLISMLEADDDSFKYFWLFFRAAALRGQPRSFLDEVRKGSREYAERLSTRVKDRIYEALSQFVNGFLAYPGNHIDPEEDLEEAYSASLILLYRILFVLYAEAHGLLPLENPSYRETYSIYRIKVDLAERIDRGVGLLGSTNNYFSDLKNLFRVIDEGAEELGVPPYNGGLFAGERSHFLSENELGDSYLARGLDLLARVPAAEGGYVFVDFNTLDVRHLGDIYEGLLEYQACYATSSMAAVADRGRVLWHDAEDIEPGAQVIDRAERGTSYLATGNGERRATGSYYTPQAIVEQMVRDSVGRAIAELEAAASGGDLVRQLLEIRVCDPSMGSGHFLVEVVDFVARAIVRAGGSTLEADDNELIAARRAVVERCIYGVDLNPLAVELAKLSLWLVTVARDKPLSFLDSHLLCGNSLVGADIGEMATLRGRSREQMNLVEEALERVLPRLIDCAQGIPELDPDTIEGVRDKQQLFAKMNRLRDAFVRTADLWTARQFGVELSEDQYLHAVSTLGDAKPETLIASDLMGAVEEAADRFHFHHWALAFPEVFLNPGRPAGFDVVLTNPPYVSAIARASSSDHEAAFLRKRFDSASGPFDLYVLFIELGLRLSRPGGWVDLITPNKVLAAPYAGALRSLVVQKHSLVQIIDASGVRVFEDPSVYPVISLLRAGPEGSLFVDVYRLDEEQDLLQIASHPSDALTRLPDFIWAFLVLDDADLLLRIADSHSQLEGHLGLQAVASTATSEAAEYKPEVREEALATSEGWKLTVTGTISPFAGRWGVEPLRNGGERYLRPVLPFRSSAVSANRREQYWAPKLIFKKLCRQLEATLDESGDYASMNTNFVLPGTVDLFALAALMHSSLMTWIFEGYFGALRMGGGYMQVQAPQLRVLPIPDLSSEAGEGSDFGALMDLGRQWNEASSANHGRKLAFVGELLQAFGVRDRLNEDPAFTLPRQPKLLAEVENPRVADFAAFWAAARATARQLNVRLTPSRERQLLRLAQAARADLVPNVLRCEEIKREVDEVVFSLYDLSTEDQLRVLSGHSVPAGLNQDD
jgi:type I restriction-modification system DNA methylase subunit